LEELKYEIAKLNSQISTVGPTKFNLQSNFNIENHQFLGQIHKRMNNISKQCKELIELCNQEKEESLI
jgi:hypothetical protein